MTSERRERSKMHPSARRSVALALALGSALALSSEPARAESVVRVEKSNETVATRAMWPMGCLRKAWDVCTSDHCDSYEVSCGDHKDPWPFTGVSCSLRVSGVYSGGWDTRNALLSAAYNSIGGDGGWHATTGMNADWVTHQRVVAKSDKGYIGWLLSCRRW